MKFIKYCIFGGLGGFMLNVMRNLQNWILARIYNNMALSWNYLRIRAKVQVDIFCVYIILGLLCGIFLFYFIKFRKGRENEKK